MEIYFLVFLMLLSDLVYFFAFMIFKKKNLSKWFGVSAVAWMEISRFDSESTIA